MEESLKLCSRSGHLVVERTVVARWQERSGEMDWDRRALANLLRTPIDMDKLEERVRQEKSARERRER